MRERMTEKEREQLRALQAKEKRVQRAEAEFLQEADERKEELLQRWGIVLQQNSGSGAVVQPAPVEAVHKLTPTETQASEQSSMGTLIFDQL